MDYVSNQEPQLKEMLKTIGVDSVDALFSAIPEAIKQPRPTVDDGLSEFEGMQLMEMLGRKNTFPQLLNFLGAGSYEHHVPPVVGAICGKSEFLTAYTPYQPEASQGMLQTIFEYQSAICALTGMDVSNASVYDGASACAEGVLMTLRANKKRTKVVIAASLHPHYREVVEQYLKSQEVEIVQIPQTADGIIDQEALSDQLDDSVAAVLLQSPNFFGMIEEVAEISEKSRSVGALTILCANPLAYGVFSSASELGVDIAVGDCQPFGIPMQFGGPYVGYVACKQALVRQLPGRLVGETVDTEGCRGFVLTLQAREQHIRRDKATSNICTNQALAALAALIAIVWYGKRGVQELAMTNFRRTAYLHGQLQKIPGISLYGKTPFFNEFAVNFGRPVKEVQEQFLKAGIAPGVSLAGYYPELKDYVLVAVTETKDLEKLNRYIAVAKEVCGNG